MTRQLVKIGNSCGIILPAAEVKKLKLKPGDGVEIYSNGQEIRLIPINRIKPKKLGGLWKGVTISEEDLSAVRKESWKELFR